MDKLQADLTIKLKRTGVAYLLLHRPAGAQITFNQVVGMSDAFRTFHAREIKQDSGPLPLINKQLVPSMFDKQSRIHPPISKRRSLKFELEQTLTHFSGGKLRQKLPNL